MKILPDTFVQEAMWLGSADLLERTTQWAWRGDLDQAEKGVQVYTVQSSKGIKYKVQYRYEEVQYKCTGIQYITVQ